jgi:predicted dinucleotide-binding enzyme
MDITIIGTGNMGRGIATRALAGGHSVTLLGTDTAKAEALAGELAGDVHAGRVADQPLDVLIASDADDAKEIVSRIVTDAGLRPIDAGPLRRARELEALGYLHMAVQQPLGTGFCSAVKILS